MTTLEKNITGFQLITVDSGREALAELRKTGVKGPQNIVIITGVSPGSLAESICRDLGCKTVVYKPGEDLTSPLSEVYDFNSNVTLLHVTSAGAECPEYLLVELPTIIAGLKSNFDTLFAKSWPWLTNGLLKFQPRRPDYALNTLEGKFGSKAALIVSAGPSLDKNIESIRQNRDKFIIFCVNVAYKRLVSEGIIPDFTLYIDTENFLCTIKDYDHSETNIITHSSAYAEILEELNPRRFFTFYCKNDLLSRWIAEIAGFSIENYETKGSVSHLALLAAYNMGCNPIILTGQDLAYPEGKFYSSGSFWGEEGAYHPLRQDKFEKTQNAACFRVRGQNGEILPTSRYYAGFVRHFEEFAAPKQRSVRLINCSPGGAQINGFENLDMTGAVSGLSSVSPSVNEVLDGLSLEKTDPIRVAYPKILEQLGLFAEDARKAGTIAEKGLQNSRNLYQELKKRQINAAKVGQLVNKVMSMFNELENNFFKKRELAMYVAFQELMEFYAIMDGKTDDRTLIFDLARVSKPLFEVTHKRLEYLNNRIIPKILSGV